MSQDELQKEILEFEELETQATQVEHSYTADDIGVRRVRSGSFETRYVYWFHFCTWTSPSSLGNCG